MNYKLSTKYLRCLLAGCLVTACGLVAGCAHRSAGITAPPRPVAEMRVSSTALSQAVEALGNRVARFGVANPVVEP
jgi:hypothetical protein